MPDFASFVTRAQACTVFPLTANCALQNLWPACCITPIRPTPTTSDKRRSKTYRNMQLELCNRNVLTYKPELMGQLVRRSQHDMPFYRYHPLISRFLDAGANANISTNGLLYSAIKLQYTTTESG